MQESSEKSEIPKFQTQTINGLLILFYKNLLTPNAKQYSTAYILCKALAKRYNETEIIKKLNQIYHNSRIGFPVGLMQTVVFRDLIVGSPTNKIYNFGYRSKSVRLGDMVIILDEAMDFFVDFFTEICVKNDLDTTIAFPYIEGYDPKRFEGGI